MLTLFLADLRHRQFHIPRLSPRTKCASCPQQGMNASARPRVVHHRATRTDQGWTVVSRSLRQTLEYRCGCVKVSDYVQSVASWGMIETAFRTSLRPIFEMSTPSILIEPDTSSTSRNKATIIDDFPAPVLKAVKTSVSRHIRPKEKLPTAQQYQFFLLPLRSC